MLRACGHGSSTGGSKRSAATSHDSMALGNLGVAAPEPSVVDLPYFHGRGGGSYRFGYAWVNQPG